MKEKTKWKASEAHYYTATIIEQFGQLSRYDIADKLRSRYGEVTDGQVINAIKTLQSSRAMNPRIAVSGRFSRQHENSVGSSKASLYSLTEYGTEWLDEKYGKRIVEKKQAAIKPGKKVEPNKYEFDKTAALTAMYNKCEVTHWRASHDK